MKRKMGHFLPVVMAFCTVLSCNPALAYAAEDVDFEKIRIEADESVQPYD